MAAGENTTSHQLRAAPTILVIEDDPATLELLCLLFSTAGYMTLQAASGGAGLTLLEHEGANLVVLDLLLPDIDGWDVTTSIRKRSTASPLILVLTGTERVNGAATSLDLGADAYLTKPFDPDELLVRIHVLLRRSSGAETNMRLS
jgi:DNA-binding response OmpR family regulator